MSSLPDAWGRSKLRAKLGPALRQGIGVILLVGSMGFVIFAASLEQRIETTSFTVPFARGETQADGADAVEAQVASFLRAYPEAKAVVVGYCEKGGDGLADVALSERRAAIVRDVLQDSGVPADRIRSYGAGSSKLLDRLPDDTDASYARRLARVEIHMERVN